MAPIAVARLILAGALLLPAAAAAAPVAQVGSIDLAGADPASFAVHEGTNRVFVSDDNSGEVRVFDGATFQPVGSVPGVGGSGYDTKVNEGLGRVYVASHHHPFTTGYNDGTGKIAVIDASTLALTLVDVPGQNPSISNFSIVVDEVRDRLYVSHSGGFGFIDAANTFTPVAGAPVSYSTYDIAVNTATGEAYYASGPEDKIVFVNGDTLALSYFDYGVLGANAPLDFAVSEQENKLYVTMVFVPGQPEPGILIIDRDTGGHAFVGRSDLNPIVFNPVTNRVLAGVQVGTDAGVLDGATDAFTEVVLPDGGVGGMDVRHASDNAFLATQQATYVMNGNSRCFQRFGSGAPLRGGVVASEVDVHQATGRAYVVNDQEQSSVKVFEDGEVACTPPPAPPPAVGDGDGLFPPAAEDDFTPPALAVVAARVQRMTTRGLLLRVGCRQEACTATVRGSVTVPRPRKLHRFRAVRTAIAAGQTRTVRLRLTRRSLAAVRRALRQGRRLVATARVSAADAAGNRTGATRRIRLRR